MSMSRPEDSLKELLLFLHVGSSDGAQVIKPTCEVLYDWTLLPAQIFFLSQISELLGF